MKSALVATLLWLALCLSAQAQPQCPMTPAVGTKNTMCANTAFVNNGLTNIDAGNILTGILPPGRTDGHMDGTATNDTAAPGEVGELIQSNFQIGSAVSLVTGVAKTITSITLTAGDWDVTARILFDFGATTAVSNVQGSISAVDNTINIGTNRWFVQPEGGVVPGAGVGISGNMGPVSDGVAVSTTLVQYLVAQSTFSISTATAYGVIRARRIR